MTEYSPSTLWPTEDKGYLDLTPIVENNEHRTVQKVHAALSTMYDETNKLFMGAHNSAHAYVNRKLVQWLLEEYPRLIKERKFIDVIKANQN